MATNVYEEVDEIVTHVDTECTALLTDGHTNTSDTGNGQSGISCRTRLVNLGRLLLHLVCVAFSLYLIWLLILRTSRTIKTIGSLASFHSSAIFGHFCCFARPVMTTTSPKSENVCS